MRRRALEDQNGAAGDEGEAGELETAHPLAEADGRANREHCEGRNLLDRLELGGGLDARAPAIGGDGEAVFEEGDPPARGEEERKRAVPELQVAIPGEGHEVVRAEQQEDGGEACGEAGQGLCFPARRRSGQGGPAPGSPARG